MTGEYTLNVTHLSGNYSRLDSLRFNTYPNDIYISFRLYITHKNDFYPIQSSAVTQFCSSLNNYRFNNEIIKLPVKYEDLDMSMKILICLYTPKGPKQKTVTCAQIFDLFDVDGNLNNGNICIRLIPFDKHEIDHYGAFNHENDIFNELLQLQSRNDFINEDRLTKSTDNKPFLFNDHLFLHLYIKPSEIKANEQQIVDDHWILMDDLEVTKSSPAELMYTELPKYSSSSNPGKNDINILHEISRYPPSRSLDLEEKKLVRLYSDYIREHFSEVSLHMFLRTYEYMQCDDSEVDSICNYLDSFKVPKLYASLDLLSPGYKPFREYIIKKCFVDVNIPETEFQNYLLQFVQVLRSEDQSHNRSKLLSLLIDRSRESFNIANYVYWYMKVEDGYENLLTEYFNELPDEYKKNIQKQERLLFRISELYRLIRSRRLKQFPEDLIKFKDDETVPLPLDPNKLICGISPDFKLFESKNKPIRLKFFIEGQDDYQVIYKEGDDMRQDQFIMQLICLMDNILRKQGHNFKLTPYKIISFSNKSGMVEFVDKSVALQDLDILSFLKEKNPVETEFKKAKDNYIHSLAGYCAITYILGIGDRHLHNILINEKGILFHIDFGYIFGNEPPLKKAITPKIKFTKEMRKAMSDEEYSRFKQLCGEAYNILRAQSYLLISLTRLMFNSHIYQIDSYSIKFIESRLLINETNYETDKLIQTILEESQKYDIDDKLHRLFSHM